MQRRVLQLRQLLLILLLIAQASLADPALYRAEYVAEYQGLPVRAKGIRELSRLEGNRYRLVSTARSILASVTESTDFEIGDNGLSPLHYSYSRKGLGKNRGESSRFDWTAGVIEYGDESSPVDPGTLDKLLYQYKLRADVASAVRDGLSDLLFEYVIADEEKRKRYQFRITGEEDLETPLGILRTVRVDRVREDDIRQTSLWLAIDHEFLLVRLIQTEQQKGFELNLSSASINGAPI